MASIQLIYQDCPTCKLGLKWSEILGKANELGFSEVVAIPYYQKGIKEVIKKASKKGFTMPFFYDGEKFGNTLMDFVATETVAEKSVKASQKASKNGAKG